MALFISKPTTTDRIYIYSILLSFVFVIPGVMAIEKIDEISATGRAIGWILYGVWLAAIAFCLFTTIRNKRTLIQSRRFPDGLYWRGIRIPQGVTSNAVWLLFPVVAGIWAVVGYVSILYGPVYIVECIATDLKCR